MADRVLHRVRILSCDSYCYRELHGVVGKIGTVVRRYERSDGTCRLYVRVRTDREAVVVPLEQDQVEAVAG